MEPVAKRLNVVHPTEWWDLMVSGRLAHGVEPASLKISRYSLFRLENEAVGRKDGVCR